MTDSPLNDGFNRVLRMTQDHPGALRATSRVDIEDFIGNAETWNVDTVRVEGATVVFLQRNSVESPLRLVVPSEVTTVLRRQDAQLIARSRKRSARQGVETRRAKGQDITAGLRAARQKKGR
jgi:hypothetical protein